MSDADTIRGVLTGRLGTHEAAVAALDNLDALLARVERAERERDEARETARYTEAIRDAGCDCGDDESCAWLRRVVAAEARVDTLREALEAVEAIQPNLVQWLRDNSIVFRRAPLSAPPEAEDERWEQIAFSIYTHVCEADSIARAALSAVSPPQEGAAPRPVYHCHCDGNPQGACSYPDCTLPPSTTEELLGGAAPRQEGDT